MPPSSPELKKFIEDLEKSGEPYEALSPIGGPQARVRFTGRFEEAEVIWDAELMTLACCYGQQLSDTARNGLRQFIEVGTPGPAGRRLKIGLATACIDEPTILKAIIMIRRYKRLHAGRYEYGEVHELRLRS